MKVPLSLEALRETARKLPASIYRRKGAFGPGNPDDDLYIPLGTSRFRITGEEDVQTISVQVAPGKPALGV